jgi:hypothetical protein
LLIFPGLILAFLEENYLTTVGNDSKMKILDLRDSYKSIYEYYNQYPFICETNF